MPAYRGAPGLHVMLKAPAQPCRACGKAAVGIHAWSVASPAENAAIVEVLPFREATGFERVSRHAEECRADECRTDEWWRPKRFVFYLCTHCGCNRLAVTGRLTGRRIVQTVHHGIDLAGDLMQQDVRYEGDLGPANWAYFMGATQVDRRTFKAALRQTYDILQRTPTRPLRLKKV